MLAWNVITSFMHMYHVGEKTPNLGMPAYELTSYSDPVHVVMYFQKAMIQGLSAHEKLPFPKVLSWIEFSAGVSRDSFTRRQEASLN